MQTIAQSPKRLAIPGTLFALLFASLVCSLGMQPGNAQERIAASADAARPVAAGEQAPAFTVRTVENDEFHFDPTALERPAIIITFRGGWCPYCNLHLSELRHVLPEINALGIDVLFLSGDRPEVLYESLKPETQTDIADLDYRIFSDASANAAVALGIAFRADPDYPQRLRASGRDISDSALDTLGVLPVPAVFAIGRDGSVVFSRAIPDFKVRVPAAEILAVAKSMVAD